MSCKEGRCIHRRLWGGGEHKGISVGGNVHTGHAVEGLWFDVGFLAGLFVVHGGEKESLRDGGTANRRQ